MGKANTENGPVVTDVEIESVMKTIVTPSPPVRITKWKTPPGFNAALKDILLWQVKNRLGRRRTGRGSFRTREDIVDLPNPEVQQLKKMITSQLEEMVNEITGNAGKIEFAPWNICMWGNVNPANAYNISHTHRTDWVWSGVYYVDVEGINENTGGDLVIEDNSYLPVAKGAPRRDLRVRPENGMMVLFSCKQPHRVEPHTASRPRISIGFNVTNSGFTAHKHWSIIDTNWRWQLFPRLMGWLAGLKKRLKGPGRKSD